MTGLSFPTEQRDWRRMARTTRRVLGQPRWLLAAVLASISVLTLFVALDTPTYVWRVVIRGDLSALDRATALWNLYPVPGETAYPIRDGLLYATAAAVGTNVAVLGHYLFHGEGALRQGGGSVGAIALGTLGAGCAPCGIAIAAGLFSTLGVTAGLAILPLDGAEFLLIALGVTVLSLHWLAEGMRAETVDGCPVNV